ncbi:MAG TPA: ATP-binding protein [Terriglobales bacterium]|nr:ATP-binding protein [Terriglobales bacterium]
MTPRERKRIEWLDAVWLLLLAGLAALPPVREVHKQLTLLAIGLLQLGERRILAWNPRNGRHFMVLAKLLLATLLIAHTGGPEINSSYYPIYYLPVVTAALYFGPGLTLFWTTIASGMYCSFLYPALEEYELTAEGIAELSIRILFFYLAALLVNRFAVENRRQTDELAETNRRLQLAQAEARRSERLAALGQLSAGLAHEIRNPLGVIKGSAEMLNQKLQDSNPLAGELAGYISSEVNRLSVLVGRFLDFARPLRTETRPQSIVALLEGALKAVAEHWHGGPVKVETAYAADLPLVEVDGDLWEQALVNLVQNAYEAMGEQGGTFRAEVSRAARNGHGGVEMRLQDTGPGVPADLREQIFNPFVTTKKSGVGLGLSIVSKIVDEHRGSIQLESAPDAGACFVIYLPAGETEPADKGSGG